MVKKKGLMGSTEWAEQHESELANAPAYFNMDVAVSGSEIWGVRRAQPEAVPARRDSKAVPSPKGGTVYDVPGKSSDQPGAAFDAVADRRHRRFAHRTPAAAD
jgi:hypothetical protein